VLLVPLLAVFALAVVAAALATTMKVWLAILIVTGILLVLIVGTCGRLSEDLLRSEERAAMAPDNDRFGRTDP